MTKTKTSTQKIKTHAFLSCAREYKKKSANKDQNSILQNMAKSLGGLAALADYGSSMSEDSESESEVEVVAKFGI